MLARLHETLAAYPLTFGDGHVEPNQQLVHSDFRSANILHDSAGIAAIIDFEDAAYTGAGLQISRRLRFFSASLPRLATHECSATNCIAVSPRC